MLFRSQKPMLTALGSLLKLEGGKLSVINGGIECLGDVQMTSGSIGRITCYGTFTMSGGHVDSCNINGTGTITGGSFGDTNIGDPLRNYGATLRVEGTESNPITITSNQWGFYSDKNTSSYLKNVQINAQYEDIYTHGNLEVYGLEIEGACVVGGQVKFENCKITDHHNGNDAAFTNISNLTLKNCTIESEGLAFSNFTQGKTVIENSTITGGTCGIMNYGELEFKSGTANGIKIDVTSKTTISGGTISSDKMNCGIVCESVSMQPTQLIISGGTIDGQEYGIFGYSLDLQISGGTITGDINGIYAEGVGTLKVSGGTIKGNVALFVQKTMETSLSGGVFENGIILASSSGYELLEKETDLSTLLADGYKYQTADFFDVYGCAIYGAVSVVAQ